MTGAAPSLSADGRLLAFLSPEGRLHLYQRDAGTSRPLQGNGERVREFVLAGDGRYVFAATESNRLLRLDVASGHHEVWLEPFPELDGASTVLDKASVSRQV